MAHICSLDFVCAFINGGQGAQYALGGRVCIYVGSFDGHCGFEWGIMYWGDPREIFGLVNFPTEAVLSLLGFSVYSST